MEFLMPLMLFLIASNTSPTWAVNVPSSNFKGIVCNQCQQWCEYTDNITGKADQTGPVGRHGAIEPPGRVGPVGPTDPHGEIDMTLIEQIIDRKIKEALLFNVNCCDGTKSESASSHNDSGGVQVMTSSSCDGAKMDSALERTDSGGVFKLIIPEVGARNVLCDLTDDGGNWTVFQRRTNGNVDFNRGWDDYVNGFGDLRGDHWLGLEAMHQMTKDGNMEMKIKMIKKNGVYWVAKYSDFRIGPGSDKYRLHVSGDSGNATDEDDFSGNNNAQFSTKDADNDVASWTHCASDLEAGGWFRSCGSTNLNGNFNRTDSKGFWWGYYDLRFSEMKLRKRA